MSRRRILLIGISVFLLLLGYALRPLYIFMAEENPSLLLPFGPLEVAATQVYSEAEVTQQWQETATAAKELLIRHRNDIQAPALSAAIAINGEVVWSAAAGYADLDTEQVATPDTVFRIGSTSKAVTGTLTARLVDAGILELDSAIGQYSDRFPNPNWSQLTLRQLASHTAGIPGYENNTDWLGAYQSLWPRRQYDNVADTLDYFDGSKLLYIPGTDFYYSSFDVVLQSFVLQEAAGSSYQQLLADWVTKPLGIETPQPDGEHPDRASFYFFDNGRAYPSPDYNVSQRMAGGGLMARPRDLARLGVAWLDAEFINAETMKKFYTAQKLTNGEINEQRYALNWRVNNTIGGELPLFNANHGGVGKGAMSWLIVVPEKQLALAMAINTRVEPFSRWVAVQNELLALFLSKI